jgi:hypothetical protein
MEAVPATDDQHAPSRAADNTASPFILTRENVTKNNCDIREGEGPDTRYVRVRGIEELTTRSGGIEET